MYQKLKKVSRFQSIQRVDSHHARLPMSICVVNENPIKSFALQLQEEEDTSSLFNFLIFQYKNY